MHRRKFLSAVMYASSSAALTLLLGQKGHSTVLETWKAYNNDRFEATRSQLSRSRQRWLEIDLRRMQVTAFDGEQILTQGESLLRFTCDDGDIYNPTVTGHFRPESSSPKVSMSGQRELAQGYKEYQDVDTYFVIFFHGGYALHGMEPGYTTTGSHLSAGCIRLNFEDARLIYNAHQVSPFQSVVVGYSTERFPGRRG